MTSGQIARLVSTQTLEGGERRVGHAERDPLLLYLLADRLVSETPFSEIGGP